MGPCLIRLLGHFGDHWVRLGTPQSSAQKHPPHFERGAANKPRLLHSTGASLHSYLKMTNPIQFFPLQSSELSPERDRDWSQVTRAELN